MHWSWTAYMFIFTSWVGTHIFGDHHKIIPSVVLTKRGGSLLFDCRFENVTVCKWSTSYGYVINTNGSSPEPRRIRPYSPDPTNPCGLLILYVMEMDEGIWYCSDYNSDNDNSTSSFNVVLESEDIPEIPYAPNGQPNDTIVEAGKVVTLRYQYTHPLDSCVWNTPYGVIIPTYPSGINPDPSRFNSSYDNEKHLSCALTITGTLDIDNGVWTCSTTSLIEDRNRVCEIGKVNITIAEPPKNITIEPVEVFAVKEKVFLVSCIVKHSRPEPRGLLWYIEKNPINPTIVSQTVDIGPEGYVDYMETVSLKGTQSLNGKILRCIYDHIAHHDGKDNNETKLTVTVNEMKNSDIQIAAIGGAASCGVLVGFILGIIAIKIYERKCQKTDEDKNRLVTEQTWE